MNSRPSGLPITIIATTWLPDDERGHERRQVLERCTQDWSAFLTYPTGDLRLHLADDGSSERLVDAIAWPEGRAWPTTRSRQVRNGVGASLNAGLHVAFLASPLALYLVDDWTLKEPFDLAPWAELLMQNDGVGAVRLGPPHPHLTGTIEMFNEGWAIRLDRHHFAMSQRPTLFHRRLFDHYGPWLEGQSALACEKDYNHRFCMDPEGPDIVYALPYPWQHQKSFEASAIDPGGP